MFAGRMKRYKWMKPVPVKDRAGFTSFNTKDNGEILIYLTKENSNPYLSNEKRLEHTQWIGITREKNVEVGDLIDDKRVDYIASARGNYNLVLSDLDDANERG